jgi:RNA polymerase-binding protein DksA
MSQQEILEAERDQILAQLRALREAVQVEVDTDPDEGDPDLHEREKNLSLIGALKKELASVDAALSAIERGTYGTCERCGLAIPPERLEVRPEATLCVSCQSEVERLIRRGFMPPTPLRKDVLARLDDSD